MAENPVSAASSDPSLLEMAAEIVSAYVSQNAVPSGELPAFIKSVHSKLAALSGGEPEIVAAPPKHPAVPIRKSITADFITCLEDGKQFRTLKRHLQTAYGLSPREYRAKWGLPPDYPMIAPNYSTARSALAKQAGLGQKHGVSGHNADAADTTIADAADGNSEALTAKSESNMPEETEVAKPKTTKPKVVKAKAAKAPKSPAAKRKATKKVPGEQAA